MGVWIIEKLYKTCIWTSTYSARPPLYNGHFCCSNNNNNNLYCALDMKSVKTLKGNNCGCLKKIINYQLLYPLLIYNSCFFSSILLPTMYTVSWALKLAIVNSIKFICTHWMHVMMISVWSLACGSLQLWWIIAYVCTTGFPELGVRLHKFS